MNTAAAHGSSHLCVMEVLPSTDTTRENSSEFFRFLASRLNLVAGDPFRVYSSISRCNVGALSFASLAGLTQTNQTTFQAIGLSHHALTPRAWC